MSYATQRDAIHTNLATANPNGKVFKTRRNTTNWADFLARFKTAQDLINVCWFSRVDGTDNPDAAIGSVDEADEILWTQKDDWWKIEFFYGFKDDDDDGSPSEYGFQILVDAIEDQFRFLQDLGGAAYLSFPLQRTAGGLFSFLGGSVLCHRAEWRLRVVRRIDKVDP